jgi:diguanylate cyclase (GGDEF)-like protein
MLLFPDRGFIAGNPATIKMFACRDEQDFTTHTPTSLSPEFQPDGAVSDDKAQEMMRLAMEKGSHFFEWTHRRSDGSDFPATVLLSRLERVGPSLLQATVRDITESKKLENRLSEMATHDALTGLPNRILLYDRFEVALYGAQRKQKRLALISIDLDRFKTVNDSYGHEVGDKLLIAAAARLKSAVRKSDAVARFGGDEFVLLLGEIDNDGDAAKVAQKVMEGFSQPFVIEGHNLSCTASIGVAVYPEDGQQIEGLLKNSDDSMYRVKNSGGNDFQLANGHDK